MIFDVQNNKKLYEVNIKNFFRDLNICEIESIDKDRVLELRKKAKNVKFTKSSPKASDFTGIGKFSNTLSHIRMNSRLYELKSAGEQYLLFTFCIDPNFEALKIFAESNKFNEAKKKFEEVFGIFSLDLLKIEKAFVKSLADQTEKLKIKEEIDKRVFH